MSNHRYTIPPLRPLRVVCGKARRLLTNLCVLCGFALFGMQSAAFGQADRETLNVGDPAPTFALKNLHDGEIAFLRDYSGETLRWPNKKKYVVIVSFFASWCVPCIAEIPVLQEFYETFKEEPIKVFLINYTPSEKAPNAAEAAPDPERRLAHASAFVKKQGYTLPVLLDEFGTTTRNFKVADDRGRAVLPRLFVIDQNGIIRMINEGFSGNEAAFRRELIATISPLLE